MAFSLILGLEKHRMKVKSEILFPQFKSIVTICKYHRLSYQKNQVIDVYSEVSQEFIVEVVNNLYLRNDLVIKNMDI